MLHFNQQSMNFSKIFKEFDFFTKYFKISHFNRDLNSMKNKTIVIFLIIYYSFVVIKYSLTLILIDVNQQNFLKELGDFGLFIRRKRWKNNFRCRNGQLSGLLYLFI